MAKKKSKNVSKSEKKKPEAKKASEPNPLVVRAREAYVGGNYAAVRTLHGHMDELAGDDKRGLEDLYQKTLTDKAPWLIAASALVATIIAGLLTLS